MPHGHPRTKRRANPARLPRAVCPDCHRETAVRAGALVNHHDASGYPCRGSGDPPPDVPRPDSPSIRHLADELAETLTLADQAAEMLGADPATALAAWWRTQADNEIEMVVSKAIEYGATDLRDLGYSILEMSGQQRRQILDAEATEIGIVFYAAGKLARIVAAVKEGRAPSYDSWLDLGVYARMAQRVHQTGGWPGLNPGGR